MRSAGASSSRWRASIFRRSSRRTPSRTRFKRWASTLATKASPPRRQTTATPASPASRLVRTDTQSLTHRLQTVKLPSEAEPIGQVRSVSHTPPRAHTYLQSLSRNRCETRMKTRSTTSIFLQCLPGLVQRESLLCASLSVALIFTFPNTLDPHVVNASRSAPPRIPLASHLRISRTQIAFLGVRLVNVGLLTFFAV